MAKAEIWQLDASSYPFSSKTETRFQDLDPLGHVNNVAMAALFENGRVRLNHDLGVQRLEDSGRWLIAALQINYVAEAYFPHDITVCSGISRIGSSSWDISSAAFQHEKCVATCVTTLVLTDEQGSKPISDTLRDALKTRMVKYSST